MSDDAPSMTSYRPYLLRALTEWINDNGMTPHIMVDAGVPGVQVPASAVKDERVVLNIAERAVGQLSLGNDYITFGARFGGVAHEVFVPVAAVLAIYSRETGQGMALPEDIAGTSSDPEHAVPAADAPEPPGDDDPAPPPPRRGNHLRVVK